MLPNTFPRAEIGAPRNEDIGEAVAGRWIADRRALLGGHADGDERGDPSIATEDAERAVLRVGELDCGVDDPLEDELEIELRGEHEARTDEWVVASHGNAQ